MSKKTKTFRKGQKTLDDDHEKNLARKAKIRDCINETNELLDKGQDLLRDLRLLLSEVESLNQEYLRPIATELRLVDEYCTYRFRDGLSTIMRAATEMNPLNVFHQDEFNCFLNRCVAINRLERWYAKKRSYSWVDQESTSLEVESYMYRRGTLKRRIWSILYLKIRERPLFAFQRQLGAMAAAGLAALWWVVAMYFISTKGGAFIGGALNDPEGLEDFWRSSGFLIVTASMLAYILKDRIKENGRSLLTGRLIRWVPDNSERILYEPPTEAPIDVGNIHEYTRFVDPLTLPMEVLELRNRTFKDELEADDSPKNIIHYRKVIEIYPRAISKIDYPLRALHDILRINISSYLTRLDDPQSGTDFISSDGKMTSLKLPKVYHMDIVLKNASMPTSRSEEQIVYDQFRLILNKRGIIRIEKLG